MPLFVVSCDLGTTKDYRALWGELENLEAFMVLNSVYLIDTDMTAVELRNDLDDFVDSGDCLFVVEFSKRPAAHRCKSGTKNWLNSRFD